MNPQARITSQKALPTWWIVFVREMSDLWIGGRALVLLILFSILLGIMAYLLATNSELSLIPPKEMVFLTLQAAIASGLFISLIIAADSLSGERERATLEALILTPTSRRQLVLGKFLAALSPWPAALIITVPYLVVLSQGDVFWGPALLWGGLMGSLLVLGFCAFGVLVSLWSSSNRTSLFVALIVYLLCLLPTQFPGTAQTGNVGRFIKTINPMEAVNHFLEKILVNNRSPEAMWYYMLAPILFALLMLGLLFIYASPGLRLEGGRAAFPLGRAMSGLLLAALLSWSIPSALAQDPDELPGAKPTQAEETEPENEPEPAQAKPTKAPTSPAAPAEVKQPLTLSINTTHKVAKTNDTVKFTTTVTNHSDEESAPLILAMNIVNIEGDGDPVDPEDWSPERARYVEPLAPGKSAQHQWIIHPILEGDYMVYMVAIPEPDGPEASSQPVTSEGLHLTAELLLKLNPGGVLPLALGMPGGLTLGMILLLGLRRRSLVP